MTNLWHGNAIVTLVKMVFTVLSQLTGNILLFKQMCPLLMLSRYTVGLLLSDNHKIIVYHDKCFVIYSQYLIETYRA